MTEKKEEILESPEKMAPTNISLNQRSERPANSLVDWDIGYKDLKNYVFSAREKDVLLGQQNISNDLVSHRFEKL